MQLPIIRRFAVITAVFFLLSLCLPFSAAISETSSVRRTLAAMTTEEKICQMLMISFGWAEDSGGHQVLSSGAAQALRRHCFGGLILFAQNVEDNADTVRLIDSMQRENAAGGTERPQLFLACDQEGGSITRLGHGTQTPGNMALGAIGDAQAARSVGQLIGSELSALGISVDFAPVVDVNSDPSNPVIGIRSFSDSAWNTASLGSSFMQGLSSRGTIACLKHFPGHGDTGTDSHTGLPCINKTYNELMQTELVPFRTCINAGAEMIMTAHIQFPLIDTEQYTSPATGRTCTLPATLSHRFITEILRGDLGFGGVVITDAMGMDAIASNFGLIEASRLAIEAGVDILLTPVSAAGSGGISALESYISTLVSMADSGEIPMEKIDAAVARILRLKQRHGLLGAYSSAGLEQRIANAVSTVGSSAHHAAEWAITKRAITLVKNDGDTLPLAGSGERTVILTASDSERLSVRYAIGLLESEGKLPQGAPIEIYTYDGQSYNSLISRIGSADNVIAISEIKSASALRSSKAELIDRLISYVHSKGGRFVILSAHLPYDAARFQAADAIILAYSSKSMNEDPRVTPGAAQYGPNIPAAVYTIFDRAGSPTGQLPVRIPALNANHYFTSATLYERCYSQSYSFLPTPSAVPSAAPEPTGTPAQSGGTDEPQSSDPAASEPATEPSPSAEPTQGELSAAPDASLTPAADDTYSPIPEETPTPESGEATCSPTFSPFPISTQPPDNARTTLSGGVKALIIAAAALVILICAAVVLHSVRKRR